MTPCSRALAATFGMQPLPLADYLLRCLFFDAEDGNSTNLRNIGRFLSDYTVFIPNLFSPRRNAICN